MNEVTKIDRLRAVFYAPGMPFDADTVASKSLGGSESAAYYLARELARLGHDVVVFTTKREPASGDGVTYAWIGDANQETPLGHQFEHYACNTPHDLLVAQRIPHAFYKQFASKVTVWQLHDLALHRTAGAMLGGMWQVDAVTVVSEWHAEQVKRVWNVNPEVLRVVPNGVDASLYSPSAAPALDYKLSADPDEWGRHDADGVEHLQPAVVVPPERFVMLYQSRPERGLNNALDLMEKAAKVGLPLHLLVCSYDNPVAHMEPMYTAVYSRANALPNVTLLGSLTKPQLAQLQQRCDLLLYPTEFEEVSCITAMEAMHAGLPMLTSDAGALRETCAFAGVELVELKGGKADIEQFDKLLSHLFGTILPGQYPAALQHYRKQQLEAAKAKTWAAAAARLIDVHAEALARKQGSAAAVLRHSVEHSDIAFAQWYLNSRCADPIDESSAIVNKTREEIDRLYAFAHSPDAYAAHYALHQGAYYDGPGAGAAGEDVTHTTRYRGVVSLIAEHLNKAGTSAVRVLDYGCAHGHYAVPLAKTFADAEFVGMDISERAVEAARGWAKRDKVKNLTFVQGAQHTLSRSDGSIDEHALGTFDLILAGEVLEHVWDYKALLDLLRDRLAPGGCLVVTTPLGRWEHSGTVPFRSAREHLHHFERGDVEDICSGHESRILHAPAGQDRSGFQMSSYVWAVWPRDGLPLWSVDYERKLRQLAPRQTVSACMIVKDGERTLRRCVESFVDWVDEVIVAVDPSTTDRTLEVVEGLRDDFPNRPFTWFYGAKPLSEGFAAARNLSTSRATGDWILWIDADEELRNAPQLHRFARTCQQNGYGFPQIHYSVDPEQVLTTDYPCRLFRNRIGVEFYGFVHEHPEQGIGKSIPWSLIRTEMKFLHHGYFDEETRQARFRRNLPLLLRDVEAYPEDRPLNKFLHLRDIAQSIQFDARARGGFTPAHAEQAWQGIRVMEKIAEMPQVKMIADSMQYYSLCVSSLGIGFDAEINMKTKHPQAPDLAASLNFNGRFHSRAFFEKLVGKFTQESIKHYEEQHL